VCNANQPFVVDNRSSHAAHVAFDKIDHWYHTFQPMASQLFISVVVLHVLPTCWSHVDMGHAITARNAGLKPNLTEKGIVLASQVKINPEQSRISFWEPPILSLFREGLVRDSAEHKPLRPLNWRDILTVIFAAISAFIAASAGLGGGGVLVPLFLLILGKPKPSLFNI
jgi:hypothetical protein